MSEWSFDAFSDVLKRSQDNTAFIKQHSNDTIRNRLCVRCSKMGEKHWSISLALSMCIKLQACCLVTVGTKEKQRERARATVGGLEGEKNAT